MWQQKENQKHETVRQENFRLSCLLNCLSTKKGKLSAVRNRLANKIHRSQSENAAVKDSI